MSDLQIGLIALGVLFILLVLGFNWWQDRRVRRRMQAQFPGSEQDPLLGAGEFRAGAASVGAAGPTRREPGIGSNSAVASAEAPSAEADDAQEPDPACEVVIEVHFSEPVRGSDLLPYLQGLRSVGRKPLRVFAETDGHRHRARVHVQELYVSLQLAVLLANRSGALNAIEWSQAWARAQDLADRFDGTIESPDQQAALEQAARLDDTCAALDTQVGLTLVMRAPRSASDVLSAAMSLGFSVDGPRLAWLADTGVARFSLSRADGAPLEAGGAVVDRLYLLLDVPCSPADPHAFGRMVDVGRELSERLDADLVDDQGKPLAQGADEVIDERLQVLFQQLEQAGLPAGGERALRVFS
ncbi:cell division protein ZipA C-terminal FtsZ-binding domain-containing protein [Bordetella genomosp. 13]|uniref:cell division protein ZipA C-terminal FtsZ-binding domain-containing protein n=1 Tax=Bordetella genomosp. 13 TaxID=463040 RepID=UPI0011A206F1|nr:cell division protein ZipA C-terminal FtsZ-binding domain-containing protein [Bordetella genomosp. 13]